MMQHFDTIIFDVDGTLLDTTEGVLASVKYTIQKFGFEMLPEEKLKKFIGPPIQNSFAKAYNLDEDVLQEIATVFRNRYKEFDLLKAKPYEGIYDLLEQLVVKGKKIAVATYKRQDYATELLKKFGFDQYTEILYGADHENKLKKSDIIRKCLDDTETSDYRKAVMIGDSDNDAIGANQIGISFIGVTYGFGFETSKDVMKFPNVGCAKKPIEILNYL